MTMVFKVVLSLLIGGLIGGGVYVILGILRSNGSDGSAEKRGAGKKQKPRRKKKPRDEDDEDSSGGKASDSGLTPTKEWVGGVRR